MKTVLVVGDSESGKDDIIEFILNRGKDVLPDYGYLKFDEYLIKGIYNAYDKNLKDVKKFQIDFQKKVTKRFEELSKKHENIIINAHFFARVRHGYISLINHEMFNTFKPDTIIILELHPKPPDPKFGFIKKRKVDVAALKIEQDIIRCFAIKYAASSNALLRVVQVKEDNVNRAFNEVMDVIMFTLGDK